MKSLQKLVLGITISFTALIIALNIAYANGMFDEIIYLLKSVNDILEVV